MSIPYPRKTSQSTVEFDVWTRPLWDWCNELLSDPAIVSQFHWHAERDYKYDSAKRSFEQCIDEPWTANTLWDIQVSCQ